ncbi:hypothetical protein QUC31_009146 [Theobroma cacao]|uniref:Uncharacterized protein LOC18606801 n=2 Tax=Theobroma cacao TaxID=3641 RepID=A0AB32VGZ9_THECC|nr:PREDICTED: uncharacterized protein LOC18606801 [Theobroma cacao]EOY25171.1 Uncharacterized protein TCM_016572 [Theobroma cacao]
MFRQCLRVLQNLGHPDPTLLVGVTFLFHTMEVPLAALLMLMGFILFSMASDMNMQHLEDLRRFGNLLVWFARQCFSAVEGVDIRVWLLALLLPRCGLGAELTIMAMLVGCIVFLLILIVKLDKDLVEALFHLHQASSQ